MNLENKKLDFITVGSDPEFIVTVNGARRNAHEFFRGLATNNPFRNMSCPDCAYTGGNNCGTCNQTEDSEIYTDMGLKVEGFGDVGWDGHDATGEMRPKHSDSPLEHVNNISKILEFVNSKTKTAKLAAVNNGDCHTGGHIHLGHKTSDIGLQTLNIFSAFMLALVNADGDKGYALKRISRSGQSIPSEEFTFGSYGSLKDWRSELRGSYHVYEFRSLTSSWMSTKELAAVTIATAGACFEGLVSLHRESPEKYKALQKRMMPYVNSLLTLQKLSLLDHDGVVFSGIARKIRAEMRNLPTYKKWCKEIERALSPGFQKEQVSKGGSDIVAGWKISNGSRIPLYRLQKEIKISECDLNDCLSMYAPSFSNDINVTNFAMEIAKAANGLNWSLKKNLRIYGVREGVNAFIIMNGNKEAAVVKNGPGTLTTENLDVAYTQLKGRITGSTVASKRSAVSIGIPFEVRRTNNLNGNC